MGHAPPQFFLVEFGVLQQNRWLAEVENEDYM